MKRSLGGALAFGLAITGAVAGTSMAIAEPPQPTAPATVPLVQQLDGVQAPEFIVVSSDGDTAYGFSSSGGPGSVFTLPDASDPEHPVAFEEFSRDFPAVPDILFSYILTHGGISSGDFYVFPTLSFTDYGYTLVNFAEASVENFIMPLEDGDRVSSYYATPQGAVTAITESGNFLELDGSTILSTTPLPGSGDDIHFSHMMTSSDQSLVMVDRYDGRDPDDITRTTLVLNMADGSVVSETSTSYEPWFMPVAFDASNTEVWGG